MALPSPIESRDGERALHGHHCLAERGWLVINPVDTHGRIVEHGSALGSRVACGQPFESVVHDMALVSFDVSPSRVILLDDATV